MVPFVQRTARLDEYPTNWAEAFRAVALLLSSSDSASRIDTAPWFQKKARVR
jgi:hypothetical protein